MHDSVSVRKDETGQIVRGLGQAAPIRSMAIRTCYSDNPSACGCIGIHRRGPRALGRYPRCWRMHPQARLFGSVQRRCQPWSILANHSIISPSQMGRAQERMRLGDSMVSTNHFLKVQTVGTKGKLCHRSNASLLTPQPFTQRPLQK